MCNHGIAAHLDKLYFKDCPLNNQPLKLHIFIYPVRKLNTHLRLNGTWIFTEPSWSLPRHLDTPDGCNSFFYFTVNRWVWLMYGHLYEIWMSESHSGWVEPWMNIGIHVCHWKLLVIPYLCFFCPIKKMYVFYFSVHCMCPCTILHDVAKLRMLWQMCTAYSKEFLTSIKFLYFFPQISCG